MGKTKAPKMPKFAGISCSNGRLGPAIYTISMDICPREFDVADSATNSEMVQGLMRGVHKMADKERLDERAEILALLKGRAKELREQKALGAAEEVETLAFLVEQRSTKPSVEAAEKAEGASQ
jgi:hypothetical protein